MEATKVAGPCGLVVIGLDGLTYWTDAAATRIIDGTGELLRLEAHARATGDELFESYELDGGGHLDVGARKLEDGRTIMAISTRGRVHVSETALRSLYGLSKAQARVAAALAGGAADPFQAAAELGVCYETVRKHGAEIRKAMGVSTTREACRIILTGPACAL